VTSPGSDAQARATVLDRDFDTSTLALLREHVMACAAAAGLPEQRVIDVTLAAHELAANAVTHGPGSGRLRMYTAEGMLCCQVSDTAPPGDGHWPVRHGHGLWLVRQVADTMTMTHRPDGSEVTVLFTRPGLGSGDQAGSATL
jgi:anti-sigma regulatory factor (Ser/Thr protein kinase)